MFKKRSAANLAAASTRTAIGGRNPFAAIRSCVRFAWPAVFSENKFDKKTFSRSLLLMTSMAVLIKKKFAF